MEIFPTQKRYSEILGPAKKIPSPQTRRQVSATALDLVFSSKYCIV